MKRQLIDAAMAPDSRLLAARRSLSSAPRERALVTSAPRTQGRRATVDLNSWSLHGLVVVTVRH